MKLKFENTYIKWGITLFVVIMASIIGFFLIYRAEGLMRGVEKINWILTPFVYGLVLAYLLCPLYNWGVRVFSKFNWPKMRGEDRSLLIAKGISTTISLLVTFIIIGALLWMVIPELIESVIKIAKQLPGDVARFNRWMGEKFESVPFIAHYTEDWTSNLSQKLTKWVETTIVPEYETILTGISDGVVGVLNFIKNIFIGIVICVFFINSKDIFSAQSKKLACAIMSRERAAGFLRGASFTNQTFGKFINGKLLDSLVVGIICFMFMTIAGWPYPLLISVIIGVTNIIPFFGPFIGAIPSTLLLMMSDGRIALYFVIFILILQQIDGNIIGPKILGDSTGLSSFWVMFAILVGGGLFGFVGMVIGIPMFAVVYAYICFAVNKRLEKKGLSINLEDYKNLYKYNE